MAARSVLKIFAGDEVDNCGAQLAVRNRLMREQQAARFGFTHIHNQENEISEDFYLDLLT
jgi:hypothetical protein